MTWHHITSSAKMDAEEIRRAINLINHALQDIQNRLTLLEDMDYVLQEGSATGYLLNEGGGFVLAEDGTPIYTE